MELHQISNNLLMLLICLWEENESFTFPLIVYHHFIFTIGHKHISTCIWTCNPLDCCVNMILLQTRNLSMAELLDWQHLRGSSPHIQKVRKSAAPYNYILYIWLFSENMATVGLPTLRVQKLLGLNESDKLLLLSCFVYIKEIKFYKFIDVRCLVVFFVCW